MCGIGGYIGRSNDPELSFEIITEVFDGLEVRGTDAAGFWGTEAGEDGKITFHKEPGKSSDFVKQQVWHRGAELDLDMLIVHARGASIGAGHASTNANNHPFTSTDKTIGLVHNGRIPESEYSPLANLYEVKSKCDSEILLRIFEHGAEKDGLEHFDHAEAVISHRLAGVRNIWSHVIRGHMAVGIGERLNHGHRRMWLFRNKFRSLWLIDLRKYLGQVFICSTPEIWHDAIKRCKLASPLLKKKIKMIELPTEEVWMLRTTPECPVLTDANLRKFDVCQGGFSTFEHTGEKLPIRQNKPPVEVVTRLNDSDDLVYSYQTKLTDPEPLPVDTQTEDKVEEPLETNSSVINLELLSGAINHLKNKLSDIETVAENKHLEGSLTNTAFMELMASLEDLKLEMRGTLTIIES